MAAGSEKPHQVDLDDVLPIVFGTARYGADKIGNVIVPTDPPHDEEEFLLQHALSKGYNFIDTAHGYGASESIIGKTIPLAMRDEVVIATKVQPEADITALIECSVRRLRGEPDILYIHDRREGITEGSLDQSLEALDDAVDAGLARAIGISNFRPAELRYAIDYLRNPVEFYQGRVNLRQPREDAAELLEICREEGIHFTASSALDRDEFIHDPSSELIAMAARYDMTLAQLAIVGLRGIGLYPVVMTKNLDHMDENKAALGMAVDDADAERLADVLLSRSGGSLLGRIIKTGKHKGN